ncbi:MAG: FAD/NAD(P)-binding protein [Ignisphaera sp.]|uniref:Ni/Fe hydrogenase subunit gamma n=1 Tax=Ignisphaera aggregans TaxID=334771 RepID=A0A7C4NMG3_9CREN
MGKNTEYRVQDLFSFRPAVVIGEVMEAPNVKTLYLKVEGSYSVKPGQFNMIYIFGLGEIPISLANLPSMISRSTVIEHTIRSIGAVTKAVVGGVGVGSTVGLRGPYGNGWPLDGVEGMDIVVVGGGIGMAPLRPIVKYVEKYRNRYGRLNVLLGARTPNDMLYKYEVEKYSGIPNTKILLSSDTEAPGWRYFVGFVTNLIDYIDTDPKNSAVFVCGPEAMMKVAVKKLLSRGFKKDSIYLSLERRMRCGVGVCGTCQFGHFFVCKDGPVFRYSYIEDYMWVEGI